MAVETILQHEILTKFAFPFLLVFFIVFAILEKTKIFGEDKKQLNALIAFVIGLIFISVAFPREVVSNMILFLTIAVVVMFVSLLLWGFVSGSDMKENILSNKGVKWVIGIVIVVSVIIALLWASGIDNEAVNLLFKQSWSKAFWTNISFIAVIVIALAVVLKGTKDKYKHI